MPRLEEGALPRKQRLKKLGAAAVAQSDTCHVEHDQRRSARTMQVIKDRATFGAAAGVDLEAADRLVLRCAKHGAHHTARIAVARLVRAVGQLDA